MLPQDEAFYPYISGLFDGEGCLYLRHRKLKGYDTWIVITQYRKRGKELLEQIKMKIGSGCITSKKQGKGWQLTIADKKIVRPLLKQMLPYLTIKKKEADLFLFHLDNWIDSRIPLPAGRWRPLPVY